MKITHKQKEAALEAMREHGTLKAGAEAIKIDPTTLRSERKRSKIFDRRCMDALDEAKDRIADSRLQFLLDVAEGKVDVKKSQLVANLSILNWAKPGFRGSTKVEGRVEHEVRVITAVPRPKYDELEPPKIKAIEKPKTVEEAIEGEVVG